MGTTSMKRARALLILILFLLLSVIPSKSQADTAGVSAGFASQSIWISRSHVTAGDSVNIFTVLYNSSDNPITGQVILSVDGTAIGTKQLTLKDGETQIASFPWTAQMGSHSVSARISNTLIANTDTSAPVLNHATGNITVNVEASPPPSPSIQALNGVASAIQTGLASTAPAILSAAHSLYNTTESLRMQAKSALENQRAENTSAGATAKQKNQSAGTSGSLPVVLGTSTKNTTAGTSFLSNTLRYMAAAGLAVVSSRTLFYISLALILLLLIQILRVSFRERRPGNRRLPID